MGRWREYVFALADSLDERADRARYRLGSGRRRRRAARVVPYRGYGTAETLTLSGRVVENPAVAPSSEGDTWRTNLRNMLRRLESDEVPGAVVRAILGERTVEATTDDEGYFHVALAPDAPLEESRVWHEVRLELDAPSQRAVSVATGEVLVPPPAARLGVISDVDDTVVFTNVTDKLRMARLVFLEGVRTRLPFEGVAAFYKALQSGATGAEANPIFYVSSSPWNLYDLLVEMFEYHAVPSGPLLLRDFGVSREGLVAGDSVAHKLSKIRPILETYPHLPFILIGDSGEKDPEIYREVVRAFPGRVLAIYIRQVAADPAREEAVARLADEVLEAGSQLVLARDSRFAAEHAAEKGWIAPGALEAVDRSAARDERSAEASDTVPTAERPPEQSIE